jgi:hypothetical protein
VLINEPKAANDNWMTLSWNGHVNNGVGLAHTESGSLLSGDGRVSDVFAAIRKALAPPAKVDPIQWLEEHRRLSPESSRVLGPFHFSRAAELAQERAAKLELAREILKRGACDDQAFHELDPPI